MTDDFQCQPNPGNQTKCETTGANGLCKRDCACKAGAGGGCVIDLTKCQQPQVLPLYTTNNC